jgi:hypothetical protein
MLPAARRARGCGGRSRGRTGHDARIAAVSRLLCVVAPLIGGATAHDDPPDHAPGARSAMNPRPPGAPRPGPPGSIRPLPLKRARARCFWLRLAVGRARRIAGRTGLGYTCLGRLHHFRRSKCPLCRILYTKTSVALTAADHASSLAGNGTRTTRRSKRCRTGPTLAPARRHCRVGKDRDACAAG